VEFQCQEPPVNKRFDKQENSYILSLLLILSTRLESAALHQEGKSAMSIYRVDKTELPVILFQADGSVMKGVVFLSASAYQHLGQQTLLDLMKEKDTFFPFRREDGAFSVTNKHTITHVRYKPTSLQKDYPPLDSPEDVVITFVGGEQLQGRITIDLPEGRRRLIDFINSAKGFFPMQSDEAEHLVNIDQVRDIKPAG
jgi:hypothetical protein